MTEPQPLDLTAFLATAEHAILQAPHGSDHEASEALISAGCHYAPRLLAAVQKMLELAGPQAGVGPDGEPGWWIGRPLEPSVVREVISRALMDEGE